MDLLKSQQINALTEVIENPEEGTPIAVKDVICTLEGHTQAASNMLKGFSSPYEATAVKKLKQAGYSVVARANCDEFAMGASTEYSAFGVTQNPWDTTRVPGGSSGGSAAAVATGEIAYSLGTDTGGSVRHPASFCNVVGLRPTYGRVSRFGVLPYGSSTDQIGPITRTVKDAAKILQIIAGHDPYDATSSPEPVPDYLAALEGTDITGLKIGVPKEFFGEGVDERIAKVVKQAISDLEEKGVIIKDISIPLTPAAVPVYYLLIKSEASSNLSRYDGIRYGHLEVEAQDLVDHYIQTRGAGFGPEVKRSILMGTYALSAGYHDAWYKQASRVRTLIRREYEEAFKEVDIIAGPTVPELPFKIGEKSEDPLAMYLTDALVVAQPLAGVPAISVPAGFAEDDGTKLPVGLQLIASHFQEETLLKVANSYEQSHPWHEQQPPL